MEKQLPLPGELGWSVQDISFLDSLPIQIAKTVRETALASKMSPKKAFETLLEAEIDDSVRERYWNHAP